MPEPVSSTASSTVMLSGVTIAGILSGVEPGILIAAFAGAIIFVLSADDFSLWEKGLLFFVSIVVGLSAAHLAASITSSLLSTVLQDKIDVAPPIGALLAAAAAVRFLMLLSAKTEGKSLIDRLLNRGRDK
ncbi:putative holin [Enterobacter asburiae]|uniref:putative holin n=1 Tax=Enterobacter asburiae TaxID=61645 RepID=UPI003EE7B38B